MLPVTGPLGSPVPNLALWPRQTKIRSLGLPKANPAIQNSAYGAARLQKTEAALQIVVW